MTISQLIKKLEHARTKHGDLDIHVEITDQGWGDAGDTWPAATGIRKSGAREARITGDQSRFLILGIEQ